MKRIFKSMFLMASAVAVALNFASCKGDDDGEDNNNDKVVIEDKDGVKYTVKISDLKDDADALSYSVTYNFIAPEEVNVEYQNIFKYSYATAESSAVSDSVAQNDSVAQPASVDVVKDSLPITQWNIVITCSKEEYAQTMYEDMKADSVEEGYASLTIDGKTITCVIDDTKGLTYAGVKALYEKEKSEIESDIAKAKETAEAEKNKETKPEGNNDKPSTNSKNSKLNLSANADEVKKDSTSLTLTYVNANAGQGVSYTFKLGSDGKFESGTVVVAFKDADEAKAYARNEGKVKNENGERIYKSVSIDGGNVVLAYSSKALAEMTEDSVTAMFNEKKAEIQANSGKSTNNNEEDPNNTDNTENPENQSEEPANNDEPQSEE
jgi:hypothetical protein